MFFKYKAYGLYYYFYIHILCANLILKNFRTIFNQEQLFLVQLLNITKLTFKYEKKIKSNWSSNQLIK